MAQLAEWCCHLQRTYLTKFLTIFLQKRTGWVSSKILKGRLKFPQPLFPEIFWILSFLPHIVDDAFSICPWRCIKEVCAALSSIADVFAREGPGLMASDVNRFVEQQYLSYREHYNSPLSAKHVNVLVKRFSYVYLSEFKNQNWPKLCFPTITFATSSGLAMQSLVAGKLRFPVRPKMHSYEHMTLGLNFILVGGSFFSPELRLFPQQKLFPQQILFKLKKTTPL